MIVNIAPTVKCYSEKVEYMLLKKEACNNLMLGLMGRLAKSKVDSILGYVEDNGRVIYAFMQTPPNNWILSDVENVDLRAIQAVVNFLKEGKYKVPGVLGPVKDVDAFIGMWGNEKSTVHMNQLIYQLDAVKVSPSTKGKLIQATDKDNNLLAGWLYQFGEEANEIISIPQAQTLASNFIKNGSAYLWKINGRIVSMVNRSRETRNGATINAVFTPDVHKRNGYATNSVAALSQKLLDEGFQFCSLYTDKLNSTSNNIYKKIGYYEVGSSIVYHFED
ncbi:GNAT family N-acetyltransferase [Virgibacillus sp. C22-A2]|uniref:GNAT family N-acetyltransferase n=1 Tax=Virgibacillus tibetensis TaxID=3042313 RepID=A0ABU6KGH5_9BACI|nr:GNAT family N-acetyltransferase [Virgibacillus sp. C22-A2]